MPKTQWWSEKLWPSAHAANTCQGFSSDGPCKRIFFIFCLRFQHNLAFQRMQRARNQMPCSLKPCQREPPTPPGCCSSCFTTEGSIQSDLGTKGRCGTLVVATGELEGMFVLACFASSFFTGQVTLTPARSGRIATGQMVGCRLPIFATAEASEKYFVVTWKTCHWYDGDGVVMKFAGALSKLSCSDHDVMWHSLGKCFNSLSPAGRSLHTFTPL